MEQIAIEDLNCSELQLPTNDIALLPDISTPTPSAPPPPLPEAIFGDNWQHLSLNDFRTRTRRLKIIYRQTEIILSTSFSFSHARP